MDDRVAQVEGLLDELESLPDPAARDKATEMVQALLELYGEGLGRMVPLLDDEGRRAAADDELVSHLLVLHDLHPVPLVERVEDALEGVRPYLSSHGGGVELLGVEDDVVRLRLHGSCEGCPSSTMTLKLAIEDAIYKVAPEVSDVEAEGVSESAPAPGPTQLLQIELSDSVRETGPSGRWRERWSSWRAAERWSRRWPASRCCSCGSWTTSTGTARPARPAGPRCRPPR